MSGDANTFGRANDKTMPCAVIRRATAEDIAILVSLCYDMWMHTRYSKFTFDVGKVEVRIRGMIDSPEYLVLIAIAAQRPAGVFVARLAELWFSRQAVANDILLYVDSAARSLATTRAIIQAYRSWAAEGRAQEIVLAVSTGIDSTRIDRLYSRLGFDMIGSVFVHRGEL